MFWAEQHSAFESECAYRLPADLAKNVDSESVGLGRLETHNKLSDDMECWSTDHSVVRL